MSYLIKSIVNPRKTMGRCYKKQKTCVGSIIFGVALLIMIADFVMARPVNSQCEPDLYYHELFKTSRQGWIRDDLEDLLLRTHNQVTPFFGSKAGVGDVLQALMELDEVTSGGSHGQSIQLFYSNAEVPQYPLDRSEWVPEHVCPIFMTKIVAKDFDAAFSDLHNLRPVHPTLHESYRGTLYFGVCPVCNDELQTGACVCGDFFEPSENARGVVARTWLYMQLRYPDLQLSNCHLEQLLAWHFDHPPTLQEQKRNDIICSQWQGNRNPYVDFPDLAWFIRIHETNCPKEAHYGGGLEEDMTATDEPPDTDLRNEEGENLPEFDPEDGNIDFEKGDDDNDANLRDGLRGNLFGSNDPKPSLHCDDMLPGDIYFYVIQAGPSRIGFLPLMDLPEGLSLYLSDTLSFASTTSARLADDFPDAPVLELTLEQDLTKGSPFGYGLNLLYGLSWEVLTQAVKVRGDAIGGDELFLFCYDSQARFRLISAITTNGNFRDDDHVSELLLRKGIGKVTLPHPMDYYVYNGPVYATNDPYHHALMDATNWLGFDLLTSSSYQDDDDDGESDDKDLEENSLSGGATSSDKAGDAISSTCSIMDTWGLRYSLLIPAIAIIGSIVR